MVNHSLAFGHPTINTAPWAIPVKMPGSRRVADASLSWPGGAGTQEFRVDRHPQAYAQARLGGRGYRDPEAPARVAAWRIPIPDRACGRAGAGVAAAFAPVPPPSAARAPRCHRDVRARPGPGAAGVSCAVSRVPFPRPRRVA